MNGTFNVPISPLAESSSNRGLTSSKINSNSSNSMPNGKVGTRSSAVSTKTDSSSQQQKTRETAADSRGAINGQRYHSTPSESSVGPSKSTPPQASLADSRQQPVAVGEASTSSGGQGASRHRVNSDSAAAGMRPESPHSPLVTKLASLHLTGIIERQREREHSCTPSPCTPTQSKFSFPSLDVDDSSSSTSRGTESTLTSEKVKQLSSNDQSFTSLTSTTSSYSDTSQTRQQPKAYAEGLKFVDVLDDEPDTKPVTTTTSTTTTSTTASGNTTKAPAKTQIVFRPIDEVHDEDITVIGGCKFFDPSQSQADYYTPPPPLHQISSIAESRAQVETTDSKDKEKKSKNKEAKSPLRLKKKNSTRKLSESTPGTEEKASNGAQTPTKVERKLSKRKEEKALKKSSPKKKRSISMSDADVAASSQPTLPSINRPPLPDSSMRKGYASFREDNRRDRSLSPGSNSLSKYSMPNLTSPDHSSSRGTTPDSSMSESDEHKRKVTLRNKLKSFMGKDKNGSKGKAVRTSWRFSDVGGVAQSESDTVVALKRFRRLDEEGEEEATGSQRKMTSNLVSTVSTSQLSLMTHKDRLTMLEDTEIIPRTYSMENIYPTYNERCVDVPAIGEILEKKADPPSSSSGDKDKKDQDGDSTSASSGEYLTASDSGSVTKITSEKEKEEARLSLNVPATGSSANLSQESASDKFMTPPENSGQSQTSMELSVVGIMDKVLGGSSVRSNSKTSTSNLVSPLSKTSTKGPSLTSTSAKVSSPRGSPVAGRKGSSSFRLSTSAASKTSGSSSSTGTGNKLTVSGSTSIPSPSSVRRSNSARGSPKGSPVATRNGTSVRKATTSPLAQKRTVASPGLSPISTRRGSSTKSPSVTTTSPLAMRKASSTKGVSPRSSPSLKRKITPGSTRASGQKPSPPKLSKTTLDSTASTKPDQKSSSFSRFARGRTPIKLKSDVIDNESPAERVQRLKEKRRSRTEADLLNEVSYSCPTTPQMSGSETRPKPFPPSDLNLSQPIKLESPHTSGSSSPTTPRRRKVGVSMPSSPMVEIPPTLPEVRTPSPNMQSENETLSHDTLGEKSAMDATSSVTQPPKSSGEMQIDTDSLFSKLTSINEQLDQMAVGETTQPLKLQPVNGGPPDIASMPAMVFTSPIHSRTSSLDVEGEPTSPLEAAAPKKKLSALPTAAKSKSPTSTKKAKSDSALAPKSPTATKRLTDSSATTSKKSKSGGLKTRLSVPTKGNKDQLSPVLEKKETPKSSPSPGIFRKKSSTASSAAPSSLTTSKTDSQKFTSARPPRPPMMSRLPSDPSVSSRRASADRQSGATTNSTSSNSSSSTGQKRPRNVMAGKLSTASASAAKPPPSSSVSAASSNSDSVKSKSSSALSTGSNKSLPGRFGLRASGRAKRISTTAAAQSTQLHNTKPSQVAESSLRRTSVSRHSMKTKSATLLRPGSSASTSSRRSSTAAEIDKVSPGRKSMRRVSSGELLPRKIKPGASATLTRDRRASQASISSGASSVYASGRASTLSRPSSASSLGLSRGPATRSMRISRGSSGRKSTTTAPRAPMLTRKATPPSTSALLSPTRKNSMKRTSSGGEVLAAFDHISAQAQGSM